MKKLVLAAILGLFSFAASANNKITIINALSCPGTVTVQFVSYMENTCVYDITSPVFNASGVYDLCDPSTWAPGVLAMPSYETFAVIVCVKCPDGTQYCLPPIGIDTNPARLCQPDNAGPVKSCCGGIFAEVVAGGGGSCFTLKIHN